MTNVDVAIIGAGPSGSVAAAMLLDRGYKVAVVERAEFPRFSIGESLLPQCMAFLQEAGLAEVIEQAGFQFKNGAAFHRQGADTAFDFQDKFSKGPGTTFQVERARFDHLLIEAAARRGALVKYRHEVLAFQRKGQVSELELRDSAGNHSVLSARFVLDASGFARVLPRLLKLDKPSSFPVRASLFCHIEDGIEDGEFDRNKILITVHPEFCDVWYWLIPFAGGRCSLGVVAEESVLAAMPGDHTEKLKALVAAAPNLRQLLARAKYTMEARQIVGYAADVSQLSGAGFALLGNAGEFLDPVFSSGVTIAMKSAQLAVAAVDRELSGAGVDWQAEYEKPLRAGVDCFRAYVNAWYDGRFQDIIFARDQNEKIRRMICSILAGYAWDMSNPFVAESERRLDVLAQMVRLQEQG
ncbi:tryptophan 7-halogenase [Simiduia sp. 21SJ11W-1]|uniref:NAD(P)/FAD-dependent oxidoreductase n=1 Tax=Simiduia sp. 21SJ11W-1 TaxID=2909669 RepID=UPI00209D80A6|nr:NAD(P)/FAD-dependent oxidoreductase [Simiduia sp. 21SJ11W-1]UTA48726.1 tryptophan 7-halogenase [Simiduia sp. 21SJ11W-1]